MSDRTQAEHEGIEEDTRPSTADLVREADDVESRADGTEPGTETTRGTDREPLFEASDRDRFGESWTTIQAAFVDDPRDAIKEADALVAELMQRLAETFAHDRSRLASPGDRDADVSTADLRFPLRCE